MKLVLLDAKTMGDSDFSELKKLGELVVYETTESDQTIERIRDADIVLTNKVVLGEKELKSAPKLKLICVLATGMNNIDLDAAKRVGIVVKNAKGYSTASVVQTTFSLLLYLRMGLAHYDLFVKSKEWCASDTFTDMSRSFSEINGKEWGIIGLGEIGRSVANVASAFGAKPSYYSTSKTARKEIYPEVSLEEVMQKDIISIHSPLNKNTENLITKKELSLLKEGATILNLGRGGIINEADLATVLEERRIYAGLDVLEYEPPKPSNPLLHLSSEAKERLFITPHIAWGSAEARKRLLEITIKNIKEFSR